MVTNLCYYWWSIKIYIVYWFINSLFGLIHVDPIISGKWCLSLSSDFYQKFSHQRHWLFIMISHEKSPCWVSHPRHRVAAVSPCFATPRPASFDGKMTCLPVSGFLWTGKTMEDMENVPWGSFKNVLMGNYGKWKHLMTMLRRKRKASAHAERIDLRFCWMHRQFDNKDAEFYKENQQACRQ